ncbi:MAG: hypothetical protein V4787_00070 [Pseudomonadota bacterium]
MSQHGALRASFQLLENEVTRLTRELTLELLSSGPRKAVVTDAFLQLEHVLADLALLEASWWDCWDDARTALHELKQVTRVSREFSMDLADLAGRFEIKVMAGPGVPAYLQQPPARH